MVLVKNLNFFYVFIGGKIGQENAFYCTLEMKNTFLEYKSKNLKKTKNWNFF